MLQSTAEQTEEEAGVKEKNYSVAQNLFYIFHPVWKEKPHYMLMLIGEAVLSIGMMLMAAAVSAVAVSSLEKGNDVIVLIGSIMAFFICYGAGNVVYTFLKIRNSLIHIEMRLEWYVPELFLKCMGMSVEKSEQESTRQRVEKAILAVSCNNRGVEGMSRNGMTFLANVLGMVVYVLIVGGLDIRILGLLIVLSGLTLISSEAAVRYDKKVTDRMASEERILNYVEHIVDDTAGGKDIRIFNLSGWLTGKYEQAMTARRKLNYGYDILDFCGNATEIVLAGVRDLCCYFYLLSMMQKGMSVGNFVFYLGLISGFASWFSQLSKTYGEMRKNNHQVNEFRSIVDEEKEGLEHKKIPTDGFDELEIVFDNVSYCYPGTEKKVLDQISFIWGKGEHLALVGLNGAGKSTLVKLICGFYVPTNGRVLVNGVDTRELNLTEYFKHLSAVFQNEWILSYTIAENVAMGKDWEKDRIWEALKLAKIDSVVKALPNGIFTYLGKEIDQNGVLLSGGELQKLFWARALYRNPKLILLDEPTAALDALAEDQLYQAYHKMTEKKSAMFISHRLASTRFCDTILMLENGKIVESGTHEELLAKKGSYAKLFEVQSRYYRERQENG